MCRLGLVVRGYVVTSVAAAGVLTGDGTHPGSCGDALEEGGAPNSCTPTVSWKGELMVAQVQAEVATLCVSLHPRSLFMGIIILAAVQPLYGVARSICLLCPQCAP